MGVAQALIERVSGAGYGGPVSADRREQGNRSGLTGHLAAFQQSGLMHSLHGCCTADARSSLHLTPPATEACDFAKATPHRPGLTPCISSDESRPGALRIRVSRV